MFNFSFVDLSPVCLSPELATSKRFSEVVLQSPDFRARNIFVIIDEVHVAEGWATFRKEYAKLWQFRARLPPSTRMLGCSATLDDATREVVIENGGFINPRVLNTTTDRPEIYFEMRVDKSIRRSHMGLHFLVPDAITSAQMRTFDKTIIFFDSKQDIRLARLEIQSWLRSAGLTQPEVERMVRAYYSTLGSKTKKKIADKFAASDSECRIMLATEAMGMGVEIAGVKTVVQYDSKWITRDVNQLKVLVQRMGRAARGPGEQGHFVWLVRPWILPSLEKYSLGWYQSSRLQGSQTTQYDEDLPAKNKKSVMKQREEMPRVFQDLCMMCPRLVIGEFFIPTGSQMHRFIKAPNPRCCFRCQPGLRHKDRSVWTVAKWDEYQREEAGKNIQEFAALLAQPATYRVRGHAKGYGPVTTLLQTWRKKEADILTEAYGCPYEPEMILPNSCLEQLAHGNSVFAVEDGERLVWHFVRSWSRRHDLAPHVVVEMRKWQPDEETGLGQSQTAFDKVTKKARDDELRVLADAREQRYREWYGDSVSKRGSKLPGDAIDRFVARVAKKLEKAEKLKKSHEVDSQEAQPRDRDVNMMTGQPVVEKAMASVDDNEQDESQDGSPRSQMSLSLSQATVPQAEKQDQRQASRHSKPAPKAARTKAPLNVLRETQSGSSSLQTTPPRPGHTTELQVRTPRKSGPSGRNNSPSRGRGLSLSAGVEASGDSGSDTSGSNISGISRHGRTQRMSSKKLQMAQEEREKQTKKHRRR